MTFDLVGAEEIFIDILHEYLGADPKAKQDFISYAMNPNRTKKPIEIPCSITERLTIDFRMEARTPLSCDPNDLDHRTENVLRNANIRLSSRLLNARPRRGTVLLRC